MGLLGEALGRGETVNDFLGVGVGSFYTADNVGGQGLPFGDFYTYLVTILSTIFMICSELCRRCHGITFSATGYHGKQLHVKPSNCTNLGLYLLCDYITLG